MVLVNILLIPVILPAEQSQYNFPFIVGLLVSVVIFQCPCSPRTIENSGNTWYTVIPISPRWEHWEFSVVQLQWGIVAGGCWMSAEFCLWSFWTCWDPELTRSWLTEDSRRSWLQGCNWVICGPCRCFAAGFSHTGTTSPGFPLCDLIFFILLVILIGSQLRGPLHLWLVLLSSHHPPKPTVVQVEFLPAVILQ